MLNNSQSISTLNTSIQKAKSDFQQLTTQNRSMISQMKVENTQLTDQLVNQRQQNTVIDNQLQMAVMKFQEECSIIAQRIEVETKKKQDLEKIVNSMKADAKEMGRMDNPNGGGELSVLAKNLKDLELKLQHIHQKHNEQQSETDEIKEAVNLSRRERVIYSTVFKGIEKDTIVKQREYQKLIKQNELLKEEFKFLQEQFKLIHNLADKEQIAFQKQYEDLFVPPTQQINDSFISEVKSGVNGPYITESNDAGKKEQNILKAERSNSVQKQTSKGQDLLAEYESQFNKLFLETGMNSVDQVINNYDNIEEWINEIFAEIDELHVDIDKTEVENEQMMIQLEKYKSMAKAPIKEDLQITKTPEEKVQIQIELSKKSLEQLKKQYMQIQDTIGVKIVQQSDGEQALMENIEKIEAIINDILVVAKVEQTRVENEKQEKLRLEQLKKEQEQKGTGLQAPAGQGVGSSPMKSPTKQESKPITLQHDDNVSEFSQRLSKVSQHLSENKKDDLHQMLSEVEKRKQLAESRHSKEELKQESADFIAHVQSRKQNSKRSKHQQQQ